MKYIDSITPFLRNLLTTALLSIVSTISFLAYTWSEKESRDALELRRESLAYANELRQASEDWTRMARVYVVTVILFTGNTTKIF